MAAKENEKERENEIRKKKRRKKTKTKGENEGFSLSSAYFLHLPKPRFLHWCLVHAPVFPL